MSRMRPTVSSCGRRARDKRNPKRVGLVSGNLVVAVQPPVQECQTSGGLAYSSPWISVHQGTGYFFNIGPISDRGPVSGGHYKIESTDTDNRRRIPVFWVDSYVAPTASATPGATSTRTSTPSPTASPANTPTSTATRTATSTPTNTAIKGHSGTNTPAS